MAMVVLVAGTMLQAQGGEDLFRKALDDYRAGKYPEAAREFRGAAEAGPTGGAFLNLGLVEWRRGRAGPAILAWEQACWADPFDARARANLAYARGITGVESPEMAWYERASLWLPASVWAGIASVSLWVAVGLVVLPGVLHWRKDTWQQALAALALAIFLGSLPAYCGVLTRSHLGFVLQRNTPLRLTPTSEAESVAKLPAGEPARELRRRGDYVFVRTSRGQGWIESSRFGRMIPRTGAAAADSAR